MSIELAGQGEALPADFPYRGEWMLKPRIFLYVPDEPTNVAPTVPQFTVSLNTLEDNWSVGFDASHFATAFAITIEALREANQRGELTLENVLANTLGGENATHKIYIFQYKGNTIEMNIKQLMQVGTA